MNKLQQLLKNPNLRFKTTTEMAIDYGQNYMDLIMNLETLDVCTIMGLYGGKKVYPELIKEVKWNDKEKSFFHYGPTQSIAHIMMLTTRSYPKWSSRADILKPGMLVTVEYGIPISKRIILNSLRNAPGTTTRILKVNNPTELVGISRPMEIMEPEVNKYGVAVELVKPANGYERGLVESTFSTCFKDRRTVAFEISWHLRKATDVERKFYYSQQHGADLVLTGK